MTDKNEILDALRKLDASNDSHWTSDGSPKLDAVSDLAGSYVKRSQILEVAPMFVRERAANGVDPSDIIPTGAEPPPVPEPVVEAVDEPTETPAEPAPEPAEEPVAERAVGEIEEELRALSELIAEKQDLVTRTNDEIRELQVKYDDLAVHVRPTEALHKTLAGYLETQARIRAARAGDRNVLSKMRDSGYVGPAPIDAAFAQRRERGTNRPRLGQRVEKQ